LSGGDVKALLLAAASIGLGAAAAPDERILNIAVGGQGTAEIPCRFVLDGRAISAAEMPVFVRSWPRRHALLRGEAGTPYRCVGAIVYELQRAGYRIGYISEPTAESPAAR
jgi:hypothetical protein